MDFCSVSLTIHDFELRYESTLRGYKNMFNIQLWTENVAIHTSSPEQNINEQ